MRSAVNQWVRTSGAFDRVIDFEAVLQDPNDPDRIAPMYDNDGLHPSIAGCGAMGNALPLSLFYETAEASNQVLRLGSNERDRIRPSKAE